MPALDENVSDTSKRQHPAFADFCVYDAWKIQDEKKDKFFVGIKLEENLPKIYFPMGFRKPSAEKTSDEECRRDFCKLVAVLCDKSLQKYFSREELKKSSLDFPFDAFLSVLQYYLDFGYFIESEAIYKKGFSEKISWPKTVKSFKPQVVQSENAQGQSRHQVVYLNLVTRKFRFREDNLITIVHKFCVKEAARLIGPLYGVSEKDVDEPEFIFDYDLFAETILNKIEDTFNDKHLELFRAMLKVVGYMAKKENREKDDSTSGFLFGVSTFAPVWEAMVDRIFGSLPPGFRKDNFNPHLKYVAENDKNSDGSEYGKLDGDRRSTLRPDTIMILGRDHDNAAKNVEGDELFILDSKFYKFGMTKNRNDLPGAESVCKQMAYAEFAESMKSEELAEYEGKTFSLDRIYNAFIMPYCAEKREKSFSMVRKGYIYGDWKDRSKPYRKIACILLDVKSVMENYSASASAQRELRNIIAGKILSEFAPDIQTVIARNERND